MFETSDMYTGMRPIELLACPPLASANAEQLWSVAVMLGARHSGLTRASVSGVYGADFGVGELRECLAELCDHHGLAYDLAPAAEGRWAVVLHWAAEPPPTNDVRRWVTPAPLPMRVLRSLLPPSWRR